MRVLDVILLLALSLCASWNLALAQDPAATPDPNNPFNVTPDEDGRIFGISDSSPFEDGIKSNPSRFAPIEALGAWFSNVEASLISREAGTLCDLRNNRWIESTDRAIEVRRIDVLNDTCTSTISHSPEEARRFLQIAADAAEVFGEVGASVVRAGGVNFPNVIPLTKWSYSTGPQECYMERATALERDSVWYVLASVTNEKVPITLKDRARQYVEEYVPINSSDPLYAAVNTSASLADGVTNYTTVRSIGMGGAGISAFYSMPYLENPALVASLESNEVAVSQANDALTASNVAILALPLFMSFIPIALVAEINNCAAFLYIICTDFFSAVPFVIKGVELVITGTSEHFEANTWIVGDDKIRVAESWVACCKTISTYTIDGIAMIAVGVSAIAVGLLLEFLAKKYMQKKIEAGDNPQPLGPALLHLNPYIPVGTGRQSDVYDYETPINFDADLIPQAGDQPLPEAQLPSSPPPSSTGFLATYRRILRRRQRTTEQQQRQQPLLYRDPEPQS